MANKFTIWINDNVNLSGLKSIPDLVDGIKEKVESVFTGLAVGAVAALGTAFWQLTKSVREFAQQELGEMDVTSALTQMGQYTDAYKEKLITLAGEYQKTTNIGDELWLKAAGQLTRFGMTSANVDQVFEALSNLTGLMDGNFDGAVMAMQRAMEGEFGLFGRLGIQLETTGDKTIDLGNLMTLLAEKGGGLLEARAETLSGKWSALQNAISDFREEVGRVLTDSLGLKDGLETVVGWIEKLTASAREGSLHDFLEVAAKKVRSIGEAFSAVVSQIHSLKDLEIVAEITGQWLKEKLIEAGVHIANFLLKKAPGIGYAIGKAAFEAINPFSGKDSMSNEQTAAAREAATSGGQYKVYSKEWRENYSNIRQNTESENRNARYAGETASKIEISDASQQGLGDRITAGLATAHQNDQTDLSGMLNDIIDNSSDKQLLMMEQIAQEIISGQDQGADQVIRVQIPEGEFIGDPEKTLAMVDGLIATDEELLVVSEVAEKSNAAAKQSVKATGDAIKVSNDAHAIIQSTMSSFMVTSDSTARVARLTNEQLFSVTNVVNTVAARQVSLQDQINSLELFVRSLLV